jgi:hypothetical protein
MATSKFRKQGPPPPPAGISLDGTPLPAAAPSTPPDSSAIHAARLLAEVTKCASIGAATLATAEIVVMSIAVKL